MIVRVSELSDYELTLGDIFYLAPQMRPFRGFEHLRIGEVLADSI